MKSICFIKSFEYFSFICKVSSFISYVLLLFGKTLIERFFSFIQKNFHILPYNNNFKGICMIMRRKNTQIGNRKQGKKHVYPVFYEKTCMQNFIKFL